MALSLAFIAPDIIEAVANGTLPRGFGLSRLTDLPISWAKQREARTSLAILINFTQLSAAK